MSIEAEMVTFITAEDAPTGPPDQAGPPGQFPPLSAHEGVHRPLLTSPFAELSNRFVFVPAP